MSAHSPAPAAKTRAAPQRPPSGFPLGHYRYRNYVLFSSTSLFMMLGCAMLLDAIHALGRGEAAWQGFLARMARPYYLAASTVILLFTMYFVIRFAWVGRKIAAGRIGPIPRPPVPMAVTGILPLGGFVVLWLILLLIMGGFLP